MKARFVSRRIGGREDPRLLTGTGRFVSDPKLEGTIEAASLRGSLADARVGSVDTSAIDGSDRVLKVLTGADIQVEIESYIRFVDQHTPPQLEEAVSPVVKSCHIEVLTSRASAASATSWPSS